MGLAALAAAPCLSALERKALKSVRRKANAAKHQWNDCNKADAGDNFGDIERKAKVEADRKAKNEERKATEEAEIIRKAKE